MAVRRNLRAYAHDKHFQAMHEVLGLMLYTPGYGGSYNPL